MNLFYQPHLSEGKFELEPEESLHAVKVLRHKAGDAIQVTDGKGNFFKCEIVNAAAKRCTLSILEQAFIKQPAHFIHIGFSPAKNSERTEWFVEKATEIGVQKISFIRTQHSERKNINLERIIKVGVSAMKQSRQARLPEFQDMVDFKKIISSREDQKFIAHVGLEEDKSLQKIAAPDRSYLILIGPEGDFSGEEIDQAHQGGFISASLGHNVLRTETAGIVACHILNLIQKK